MTNVGIVAEGSNDFPILQVFIENILPTTFPRPINFVTLQPEPDATTGRYRGGGWGRVIGWCDNYSTGGLSTYFAPLFEGDIKLDFIVIHIDGDILPACANFCNYPHDVNICDANTKVIHMEKIIEIRLNATVEHKKMLAIAVPLLHTEAWIMAGVDPNSQPWEAVDAKEAFLLNRGNVKRADFYRIETQRAAANLELIRQQCVSFVRFESRIQALEAT